MFVDIILADFRAELFSLKSFHKKNQQFADKFSYKWLQSQDIVTHWLHSGVTGMR